MCIHSVAILAQDFPRAPENPLSFPMASSVAVRGQHGGKMHQRIKELVCPKAAQREREVDNVLSNVDAMASTDYRHVIEYLLYVQHSGAQRRTHLSQLWHDTLHLKWGPFFRLRSAAKHLGFYFEDPSVFIVHEVAYSVDEDICSIKHTICDSYRQFYLAKASQRRQDCLGQTNLIDVVSTRAHYLSLNNPLHQTLMHYVLTGSLDHASRLHKSKLTSSPICPYCSTCNETAEHIFLAMHPMGYYSQRLPYTFPSF